MTAWNEDNHRDSTTTVDHEDNSGFLAMAGWWQRKALKLPRQGQGEAVVGARLGGAASCRKQIRGLLQPELPTTL